MAGETHPKARVWCRFRPTENFASDNIAFIGDKKNISVHISCPNTRFMSSQLFHWSFKLDGVFYKADQETVYNIVARDIINASLDGYSGTFICYGQTGAGKTYTISGISQKFQHRGIIPRSITELFKEMKNRNKYNITARVSYFEIYNEEILDLLASLPKMNFYDDKLNRSRNKLLITENQDGITVKGLLCHFVQSEDEALKLLFQGEVNRSAGSHHMNRQSSRSHSIFTIYLELKPRIQTGTHYLVSRLNFVDLAGFDHCKRSQHERKQSEETGHINRSLYHLEQMVIALSKRSCEHMPVRESKLTHFLKDSIGGKCNTVLIANVLGEKSHLEESVSTLRFATYMMNVPSRPHPNEVCDPQLLMKKLQKEVQHLKSELAVHSALTDRHMASQSDLFEVRKFEIRNQVWRYLQGDLNELEAINLKQIETTFEAFKEFYHEKYKETEALINKEYMLVDMQSNSSIIKAEQAASEQSSTPKPVDDSAPVETQKSKKALKKMNKRAGLERNERQIFKKLSELTVASFPDRQTPQERIFSTPPPRGSAFEEFKSTAGHPTNQKLIEAKEMLATKRKACSELANQINEIKQLIDKCRENMKKMKAQREALHYNLPLTLPLLEAGPGKSIIQQSAVLEDAIILSEAEFQELNNLNEFKTSYRRKYFEMCCQKDVVARCQTLVDQFRVQLIEEFDKWFSSNYLYPSQDHQASLLVGCSGESKPHPVVDDTAENEFEMVDYSSCELAKSNSEFASYSNAKSRIIERKLYASGRSLTFPSLQSEIPFPVVRGRAISISSTQAGPTQKELDEFLKSGKRRSLLNKHTEKLT